MYCFSSSSFFSILSLNTISTWKKIKPLKCGSKASLPWSIKWCEKIENRRANRNSNLHKRPQKTFGNNKGTNRKMNGRRSFVKERERGMSYAWKHTSMNSHTCSCYKSEEQHISSKVSISTKKKSFVSSSKRHMQLQQQQCLYMST